MPPERSSPRSVARAATATPDVPRGPEGRPDFEHTAEAMRGDLRASGWRACPPGRLERWTDGANTLTLATAWELARRDAAPEVPEVPEVAPPREPVVVRDPEFDQRAPDNDAAAPPPGEG